MTLDTPSSLSEDKSLRRRLAFAVFAPPVAWFLHEIVGVSLIGRQCQGSDQLDTWQWVLLVIVFIVAAGTAATAAVTSLRVFRRERGDESLVTADGRTSVDFIAIIGFLVSCLLLLNIIYFGVMPFLVDVCARAT